MTDQQSRTLRSKMLGALIRVSRLKSGKSLKETSGLIGISSSTLSSYEHGRKSISLPELEMLAFHLNIPLGQFLSPTTFVQSEIPDFEPGLMVTLRQRMIGTLIRSQRKKLGISIKRLAETVDMPSSRISAYEHGNRPIPVPDLEDLLSVLGGTVEEYVDNEGPIGEWNLNQQATEKFLELPIEIREFFNQPNSEQYLRIAMHLAQLSYADLRNLTNALKELTA